MADVGTVMHKGRRHLSAVSVDVCNGCVFATRQDGLWRCSKWQQLLDGVVVCTMKETCK